MNIKWATLGVGALFGFAHIGILGHILNRPQYPVINFPDGDYSSFKVQSGKNGYSFEYKANDPTVMESTRSLTCLLYTSPSPRDATLSRMPSSA